MYINTITVATLTQRVLLHNFERIFLINESEPFTEKKGTFSTEMSEKQTFLGIFFSIGRIMFYQL